MYPTGFLPLVHAAASDANVTASPGAVALTTTAYQPSILVNVAITPDTRTLTATQYEPTIVVEAPITSLLVYVGGTETGLPGDGSTTNYDVDLTNLTGGIGSAPQAGDIVVVSTAFIGTTDIDVGVNTTGYTEVVEAYVNATADTNHAVSWKIMGGTPDTLVNVITGTSTLGAGQTAVHVWRSVDQSTPIDVTYVASSGTTTTNPDAASVTPVTSGCEILLCAASGIGLTSQPEPSAPSGTRYHVIGSSGGTNSTAFAMIASYGSWVSGAYDAPAWTGGSTGGSASWSAVALVLRPVSAISVTPGQASLAVTAYAPTALVNHIQLPDSYALTATTQTPTRITAHIQQPGSYALTVGTLTPTSITAHIQQPDSVTLTATTQSPTRITNHVATPGSVALAVTPYAPDRLTGVVASPATAALSITRATPFTVTPCSVNNVNLLLTSEDFTRSEWLKELGAFTADAGLAPDSTTTADKFVPTAVSGQHWFSFETPNLDQPSASSYYNFSIYLKADGYDIVRIWYTSYNDTDAVDLTVDLSTGRVLDAYGIAPDNAPGVWGSATEGYASVEPAANGFYRLSVGLKTRSSYAGYSYSYVFVEVRASETVANFTGDGTSGILAWGAQLKPCRFPGDYTPAIPKYPEAAALTITGYAPEIQGSATVTPDATSLVVTPSAPAIAVNHIVQPGSVALQATTYAPTGITGHIQLPGSYDLTLGVLSPTRITAHIQLPGSVALTLTGQQPVKVVNHIALPDAANLVATLYAPDRLTGVVFTPADVALAVTTQAPTRITAHIQLPDVTAATIAGYAPTASIDVAAQPGATALTITPQQPVRVTAHNQLPDATTLAITAYAPDAGVSYTFLPDSRAVNLTGHEPTLAKEQYARPTSDIAQAGWLPSTGTDLYAKLDEPVVDDADYIYGGVGAGASEVGLSALDDPQVSTGHKIRYRIKRDSGGPNLNVHLYCGATLIASWNHASVPTTYTTYEQTLSGAEADAITNYADLRVKFEEIA